LPWVPIPSTGKLFRLGDCELSLLPSVQLWVTGELTAQGSIRIHERASQRFGRFSSQARLEKGFAPEMVHLLVTPSLQANTITDQHSLIIKALKDPYKPKVFAESGSAAVLPCYPPFTHPHTQSSS
jgi:hypothetical protein